MELFKHRFDSIGSLYTSEDLGFQIGPICRPSFYVTDRGKLYLERGPFKTVREYFLACAQRELDCARTQFAQDTSDTYQQDVEEARFTVERSMELLVKAINGCKGLDDDEPETNKFSLSFMDLDLTKIYVSQQDPTKIVSLKGYSKISFFNSRHRFPFHSGIMLQRGHFGIVPVSRPGSLHPYLEKENLTRRD